MDGTNHNGHRRHGDQTLLLCHRSHSHRCEHCQHDRSRWKIENEHNNTLKTKGYHLEHNFGHGHEHLSNFLMTLNLLVFLFHTVAHRFDRRYQLVRKTLGRRETFFSDVQALTKYFLYDNWTHLLIAMINGLELENPGG